MHFLALFPYRTKLFRFQVFTFEAAREVELHVVVAHDIVLLDGEDVAVSELVLVLVVVELGFEVASA